MRGPLWGQIGDVPGVQVGHATRIDAGWLSGVSVVLPPPGTIGAVDVRGGGPGTHETDALDPTTLVPQVHAVTLTGGSAYGLASAGGVQRWCEQDGRGFVAAGAGTPAPILVPIVPAAAIFDLGRGGDVKARPDAELGYQAAVAASSDPGPGAARDPAAGRGSVGAGTGAFMAGSTLKGGVGTASIQLPNGVVVGALAVVNALGSPLDPVTGTLLGRAFVPPGLPRPEVPDAAEHAAYQDVLAQLRAAQEAAATGKLATSESAAPANAANTTLAVVATNATLDPARARRMATAAHDGIARALAPAHTLFDGDTVFALATGQIDVDLPAVVAVQAAAADAVLLAVLDAVLSSTSPVRPVGPTKPALPPGYAQLYPSAVPTT
jgi:L-aminopeptidase/D-esterase-like protein